MMHLYSQKQKTPNYYYGNSTDIQNAKRAGISGNFVNTEGFGRSDYFNALQNGGYVLGGPNADGGISKQIFQQAENRGYDLNRVAGPNRGATYSQLLQLADNPNQTNYYGNAVDIGNARNAGLQGDFYNVAGLDPSYVAEVIANGGVVLGGPNAAVNNNIYQQAAQHGADLQRIAGDNRQETLNKLERYKAQQMAQNPIDMSQYKTDSATIQDLMSKYGFDYSHDYAKRIAEAEAQAKRDAANEKKQQAENGLQNEAAGLDRSYFLKGLQQDQQQTNSGLNAGIAADQNLRLAMARQAAMAGAYDQANQQKAVANDALGRIKQEKIAQTEQLYNQRLQQAFDQIQSINKFNQTGNLARLQAALAERGQNVDLFQNLTNNQQQASQFAQQMGMDEKQFNNLSAAQKAQLAEDARQFNLANALNHDQLALAKKKLDEQKRQYDSETAWRKHEYNNMSAYQKAQLNQNSVQFGKNMAWQMYEMQQQMNYYNAGFKNSGGGGDWQQAPEANRQTGAAFITNGGSNSVSNYLAHTNTPESYQRDLAQAVRRVGIPTKQLSAFNWIISHESSFNPHADNPTSTAYGYGQFLKATRNDYERKYGLDYSNPVNQLILAYHYMVNRYGSPQGAVQFWKKHHWY